MSDIDMIEIVKAVNADSRSATNMTVESLAKDTAQHIRDVAQGLEFIANRISDRGEDHDHTKMNDIDGFFAALNTDDVKRTDWYQKHITDERHHLKSHCPDDVTLIDVIEHLVDCTMAGLARSGEVYDTDIDPAILQLACQNTVQLIKNHTKVAVVETDDIMSQPIE